VLSRLEQFVLQNQFDLFTHRASSFQAKEKKHSFCLREKFYRSVGKVEGKTFKMEQTKNMISVCLLQAN